MKNSISILVMGLAVVPFSAARADYRADLEAALAKAEASTVEDIATDTAICVRKMVERRLGGKSGLDLAQNLITVVVQGMHDRDKAKLVTAKANCEEGLVKLQRAPMSREQQYSYLGPNEQFSPDVSKFVSQFVKPTVECEKVGLSATVAVLFAVGAKVDGSLCNGTNGRRWIELDLGVSGGAGLDASLDVTVGGVERKQRYYKTPITGQITEDTTGGLVWMAKVEGPATGTSVWDGNGYAVPIYGSAQAPVAPIQGRGIGLGFASKKGAQVNIKIIPLMDNRKHLIEELERISL